jgi:hypothetical protein
VVIGSQSGTPAANARSSIGEKRSNRHGGCGGYEIN